MSLADVAASITAYNRAVVTAQTWGHLAPAPRRKYHGSILFTHGEYGDITPIRVRFDDLPDSPWFFEGLNDFISSKTLATGEVYRFEGTYMLCRNGQHRFSGRVRRIPI